MGDLLSDSTRPGWHWQFFRFFLGQDEPDEPRVNITARPSRPFGTEDAGLKTREEAGGPHDVASVMGDDYEEVRTSTFAL
jgi:hypothetical protein